jgi:hypothetical protein
LYRKIKGKAFELVGMDETVDLTEPGLEHFEIRGPVAFGYTLDEEPETTTETQLTPNQILAEANLLPVSDYYLVELEEDGTQDSYLNRGDEPITMKCPALKFVSIFNGETPVSQI